MLDTFPPAPAEKSSCGLAFDLGRCVNQLLFGWVPDWVWTVLAWWPWILGGLGGLLVLGILYRVKVVFGWPGVAGVVGALLFGAGYVAGRRGRVNPGLEIDGPDAEPSPPRPRSRRRWNDEAKRFESY